ncbi:MAG: lipocalin-like domain-containing protein [Candidatus Caenarcaniphilales bacterium]|nr:lipocalin-like domain-containing protein [Candidatus Caenarcaniphilales bacterium]
MLTYFLTLFNRTFLFLVSFSTLFFCFISSSPSISKKTESTQNTSPFSSAEPGYWYQFPKDHSSHSQFSTEWWYYTGNLFSPRTKSEYGYQLTFFRIGLEPNGNSIYAAHFAVSDIEKKKFYHFEKINRSILSKAGIEQTFIWNGNWSTNIFPNIEKHILKAEQDGISINLTLQPLTNPIIHGIQGEGISRKGSCKSCASHYYSFPLIETSGKININGKELNVVGKSWMDHEFGSSQLEKEQVGWDWFSIQFSDESSLMIYQIREKNGKTSKFSSASYISNNGEVTHLKKSELYLKGKKKWKSPKTNIEYPLEWEITIPKLNLGLKVIPKMFNQELTTQKSTAVNYWEGAIKVIDRVSGKKIGSGYLELTGYDESLNEKI